MDEAPAPRKGRPPQYRIPSDEEVVAAIVRVMLREGQVHSQRRLKELVERALRAIDASYRVGEGRVRHLALRSGLVGVAVHARHEGETPRLDKCPVCGSALVRTSNRTLTGGHAQVGYKCSRCPWWTGRDYRIPNRYDFFPLVESKGEDRRKGEQLTFRESGPRG